MKIFKLSFKNINNLKGENSISFEDGPLSSAGIFAITGPTGSGKSTILDVITLSLFNKIPRFKGAISKNAIEGMGSVITHHTSDAYARLEYEIKGRRYTSEWITKNTKAGKFVDYEMHIYDAYGKPLDLKKSEVPAKNEEIIGLKYDQFVKSIILSQGQFAKFLKANKDERGQLLENLTGSSIYRKIGRATFDKYRTIKNEVMLEKDRLENISCLSVEERKILTEEIAVLARDKEVIDKELKLDLELKKIKSDLYKIKSEIAERKEDQKRILIQESNFESEKKKLEIYDKLAPLRGEITRSQDAAKKSILTAQQISQGNQKLLTAQSEYEASILAMGALTGQKVDGDNFSEIMSVFEKEINTLDQELKHIIAKGSEVRARITQKSEKGGIDLGAKPNPSSAIPLLNEKIKELEEVIESAGLSTDSNVQESRVQLELDTQNLQILKDIKHGYVHESELIQKIQKGYKLEKKYKEEISKYEPIVKIAEDLFTSTSEKIELLERRKQDQILVASLSDHRVNLEDGKPCPLCGAEHHPWAEYKGSELGEIDAEIIETRSKLNECQANLKEYTNTLTSNRTALEMIGKQVVSIDEELKQQKEKNKGLLEVYKGEKIEDIEAADGLIKRMDIRISKLNKAIDGIGTLSVMEDLLIDFREMEQVTSAFKSTDASRKSKYKGKDVSADCNLLQDKYVNAKTRVATYKSRVEESKKSLTELEGIVINGNKVLLPKLEALGFEGISAVNDFLISEIELEKLKLKKEEITEKKTTISTQLSTLVSQSRELNEKDSRPDQSLEVLSQIIKDKEATKDKYIEAGAAKTALLKKDDEEQERQKNKALELEKLNMKLEKWGLLNKMIGDKNGNKFANFAQGLTLQNLLVFANKRLQNLSDRYLLNKPVDDGPLTVMDQYQGNIQRSVTTLSGGESFLISLALALSLSDMASKNVKLQSLFIDEGFGTLDQDTLEVAMNTLEKLQTESQKTVGVISHVEALKERINVQVKLQKDAMGYSSIQIES